MTDKIRFLFLALLALLVWSYMVFHQMRDIKQDLRNMEKRLDQIEILTDGMGLDRS